jgi:hypothetical protein
MNFYELLRLLIDYARLPEPRARDAHRLVADLERVNALGTITGALASQEHECLPAVSYRHGIPGRCIYCGKPRGE